MNYKNRIIIFSIGLIIIFIVSLNIAERIISEDIETNKKYFESNIINIYDVEFPNELNISGGTTNGKFKIDFIWGGDQLFRILAQSSGFIHEENEDKINVENFSLSFYNDSRKYIQMKSSGWTILGDKLNQNFNQNIIYFKVHYPSNLYAGKYNATLKIKLEPIIDEETYIQEQLWKLGNWGQWFFSLLAILIWVITFIKKRSCKHKNITKTKLKNNIIIMKCLDCEETINIISTKWKF
jgi:hypothetical protein